MGVILLVWAGFELKHLAADYLLQTSRMVAGKGHLGQPGGYAHAGVHVAGSLPVLLLAGAAPVLAVGLLLAEFITHYAIDFAKASLFDDVDATASPRAYWALHGIDQTLHRFTYIAMSYVLASVA